MFRLRYSNLLVLTIITSCMCLTNSVRASDTEVIMENDVKAIENSDLIDASEIVIPTLEEQVIDLCNKVSIELGVDEETTKLLYTVCIEDTIYSSRTPNIYRDETINSLGDIKNDQIEKAPFIDSTERDNINDLQKYLPDYFYTLSKLVINNKEGRYNNRESNFNALTDNAKDKITLYESIIQTIFNKDIDLSQAYADMLTVKHDGENLVEITESGVIQLKQPFRRCLERVGIDDTEILHKLAILISTDEVLANSNGVLDIEKYLVQPYKLNGNNQYDMIKAATSIVGKCRYVWGGGHDETSSIDGINVAWLLFDSAYNGADGCIRPAGSNCIEHGEYKSVCTGGKAIHSTNEYAALKSNIFDTYMLETDEYSDLLSGIGLSRGIDEHRLDGLDCSGFVSWVYNQTTSDRKYNAVAEEYVETMGLDEISIGSELEPGDVFAWKTHIITIVAQLQEGSKAYLQVEAVPDRIQFGVAYYSGVKQSDLDMVSQLATELNQLVGGMSYERASDIHKYNMSTKGTYKIYENEEVLEDGSTVGYGDYTYGKFSVIGRRTEEYEEIYIEQYGKNFSELYAVDMMNYIVNTMPLQFLYGYKDFSSNELTLLQI